MIDLKRETVIPLTEALRQYVPTRPYPSTGWKWVSTGVRGVKLEVVKIGGKTCTSREAVERFLSAINGRQVELPAKKG